jgi:replication factor A1
MPCRAESESFDSFIQAERAASAHRTWSRTLAHGRLVIILKLEILPYSGEKIGNPANLEQSAAAKEAPVAVPQPAANGGSKGGPPSRGAPAGARGGAAAARGGRQPGRATTGKDMGPLYPIEGLSPYQNK